MHKDEISKEIRQPVKSCTKSLLRAVLELPVLATAAWLLYIYIEPDAAHGLNIPYFGLKWLVYTFMMAATVYVLVPFCVVFALGAAISRLNSPEPSYWTAYRIAFVIAVVWTLFGNYGNWWAGRDISYSRTIHYAEIDRLPSANSGDRKYREQQSN